MPESTSQATHTPSTSPLERLKSLAESDGARLIQGRRHLIDVDQLSIGEIECIIETARQFKLLEGCTPLGLLEKSRIASLFYETSTRTKSSFEIAAKNLGATVVHLDISTSSVSKGESVSDTARTLTAMGADAIIQRQRHSGAATMLAKALPEAHSVVNAGEGWNSHPTQALLDYFTMLEHCRAIKGKKVTIVGDLKYSRVARSNIRLLTKMEADVHVCGPPFLVPTEIEQMGVTAHFELDESLQNADFIMVLRLQKERQREGLIPSLADYIVRYRVDHERVEQAGGCAKIMHPGPMNRGVEITSELAGDTSFSIIERQVANGVFVRMAVLFLLLCGR